ncbi:winged helix-turn-helix domain-containing protein [Bowmanella denitrificans]|uniref:Winged helix-turn-helix domain-containing protein n=2 Tax=Bowmanella denitrificans TaxID=366582 RepID=A0ABP3GUP9_9ALTE
MAGKALTATELALEAEISSQTASSHLAKLLDSGLLLMVKQGRHKYFRLRNEQVARLIENLLNLTSSLTQSAHQTGPQDPMLRRARVCYDHLAGELGVRLYQGLLQQGLLVEQDSQARLTEQGKLHFNYLGCDILTLEQSQRPLCRACLDWSERRFHLAGSLGHWILEDIQNRGWAKRIPDSRAMQFSQSGEKALLKRYLLPDITANKVYASKQVTHQSQQA